LTTLSLAIGFVGLLLLGVEYFVDLYFTSEWVPEWSLIAAAISVALIIPLQIIRHVPALREEVRRRFSL
ncbi:MAG: zinc ribbon domain-containing protein, partial [Oscillospiraceae bacterium]